MATPKMTGVDILWSVGMIIIVIVLGCGAMMLGAVFIEPRVLPPAASAKALHGWVVLEEGTVLMGSLVVGEIVALAVIGGLARRCLSPDVHHRWVEQFESSRARLPTPHRLIGGYFIRITRPSRR